MKVAIIILNWNGRELLEQFLPSVINYSSNEATVYIADNASTDDSVAYVRNHFPSVQIIQNKVNGGYAKGYNDALKNLTEDLFVLLNSDVEVTENWLTPIIQEFNNNIKLVAAQPKILDYKDKSKFEYAGAGGGFIDKLGYPYCRGRIFNSLEKDSGQFNDNYPIFWASGACLILRSSSFWESGALDETYFTHQEEIDLCWRMKALGGEIFNIGSSTVYHVGGATLAASNPKKTFYNFRNSLLTLLKNKKGSGVWVILFLRLVLDGIAGIQFIFQGKIKHCIAIIHAHFSFYGLLPSYIKKRKNHSSTMKYYSIKSIVWNYFILKKRTFNNNY
ncbi:MAG: glycosyltransferase family 2 protein [Flavobacteriaceae bacterium]|nr:glycosyltransferase family 2 protein [Flavobacteriaceae bacterium]